MLAQILADAAPATPAAALVAVFVLIMTGKLTPARTLRQLEEARDRHTQLLKEANATFKKVGEQQAEAIRNLIEQRDGEHVEPYKTALATQAAANERQAELIQELLEGVRLATDVAAGVKEAGRT